MAPSIVKGEKGGISPDSPPPSSPPRMIPSACYTAGARTVPRGHSRRPPPFSFPFIFPARRFLVLPVVVRFETDKRIFRASEFATDISGFRERGYIIFFTFFVTRSFSLCVEDNKNIFTLYRLVAREIGQFFKSNSRKPIDKFSARNRSYLQRRGDASATSSERIRAGSRDRLARAPLTGIPFKLARDQDDSALPLIPSQPRDFHVRAWNLPPPSASG